LLGEVQRLVSPAHLGIVAHHQYHPAPIKAMPTSARTITLGNLRVGCCNERGVRRVGKNTTHVTAHNVKMPARTSNVGIPGYLR
jgi:hypothetical protein